MGLFGPNIDKLEKAGDIDGLLHVLKSSGVDAKIEAFKALAKNISDVRIHDELRKMMDDPDPGVVATAVLAFYNLGESVNLNKLETLFREGTVKHKVDLLKAVGEKCKEASNEISGILLQALNDKNLLVVEQAIRTIGTLKITSAVDYLAQKLSEKNHAIRLLVVDAFRQIGGEQVVDPLISVLMDSDQEVRDHAKLALQNIGTAKALNALNDAPFLLLLKGMSDKETVRIETIKKIARQNISEALGLLHKACSDNFKEVRIEALRAIAVFSNRESVPYVASLLEDKFFDVRLEAVKALEHFPFPESLEALEKVMKDPNHSVTDEAKIAHDLLKKKS